MLHHGSSVCMEMKKIDWQAGVEPTHRSWTRLNTADNFFGQETFSYRALPLSYCQMSVFVLSSLQIISSSSKAGCCTMSKYGKEHYNLSRGQGRIRTSEPKWERIANAGNYDFPKLLYSHCGLTCNLHVVQSAAFNHFATYPYFIILPCPFFLGL